jgi:para-nitrobenzyl esterase
VTVVKTSKGEVRGVDRDGATVFLGIPFAQPPTGERRFAAPVPPEPWPGVRDATAYGATPQRGDTGITLIPEPSIPGDDTLGVNVFTPRAAEGADLPVLVWIHGGGYVSGSPASPWYDGTRFARDGVVVVTVSYRLGFDGFGAIEGAPANRGVRDWIAALQWVQDEIRAFGGDPARVTIAGQSAGGGAVLTLLAVPAARGLFAGALALSPAVSQVPHAHAVARARRLAALARVAPTREGFASVPEERMLTLQRQATRVGPRERLGELVTMLAEGLPWGPEVDGDLIPVPVLDALAAGDGADVPLVVGATDDEFTMTTDRFRRLLALVPAGLALGRLGMPRAARRAYLNANAQQRRKGTAAVLGRYVTDRVFRSVVAAVTRDRTAPSAGGAATWTYRFSWPSPVIGWACHCLDVPFWWGALDADGVERIAGSAPPADLATAMHEAAVAFVRDGDPGWPRSSSAGETRVFGGPAASPAVVRNGYATVAALL